MRRYDAEVIVVGAGPAGTTAARSLAAWGVSVLLLERCRLPRYKPCGGAITKRTIQFLAPLDISPVIETWVRKLVVQSPNGESFTANLLEGLIATVMRDKFDTYLTDAAILAGAMLKSGEPVLRCEQKMDGVEVTTTCGTYRCLALIGADGANSVVAEQMGLKPKRRAVSIVAELSPEAKERWDDNIHLHFPFNLNGYAWCFPKGDHLSVGIYTRSPQIPDWREWLHCYLANLELNDCLDRRKNSRGTQSLSPTNIPFFTKAKSSSSAMLLASLTHSRARASHGQFTREGWLPLSSGHSWKVRRMR